MQLIKILLIVFIPINCGSRRFIEFPPPPDRQACIISYNFANNFCPEEISLFEKIKSSPTLSINLFKLKSESLKKIYDETKDIDLTSAFYYLSLISNPKTQRIMEYLQEKEEEFKKTKIDLSKSGFYVAIIPGMFYKDNPITGADGEPIRKVLKSINMPHGNISIGQDSPLEKNAITICKFIQEFKDDEKIILYGTSKGGSDIKKAINLCGNEKYFSKVKGWLNVAGLLQGTQLVTNNTNTLRKRLFLRFLTFLYGYNYQGLYDIRKEEGSPLSTNIKIPTNFYVLNIIGIPLTSHITLRAFPNFRLLQPYGPNDGLTLLQDAIVPEGDILPLWGNDHYFIKFRKAESFLAVLYWIMETIKSSK